jgi:hypothetical protein
MNYLGRFPADQASDVEDRLANAFAERNLRKVAGLYEEPDGLHYEAAIGDTGTPGPGRYVLLIITTTSSSKTRTGVVGARRSRTCSPRS